jgi:hypothetical protein
VHIYDLYDIQEKIG